MKVCRIPNCPALRARGLETCRQHELCAVAGTLTAAVKSKCDDCKRSIREDDWLWSEPRKWQNRLKEWRFTYRHVQCSPAPPRVTKRQIRESEKPLFALDNI